jgi:ATP-binding cassette subfamily G (WHITE) protein 2 (SNQ2)
MENTQAGHATTSNKKSAYVVSIPVQTRAVMVRRPQILKGSEGGRIANIVAFIIQAIVVGTVPLLVLNTTATFFSRGGVLYLFVVSPFVATLFILTLRTLQSHSIYRSEFHGQNPHLVRSPSPDPTSSKAAMYHPFIEAAAMTLVDIPITLATLTVHPVVLYFPVGPQESAGQFL